MSRPANQAGAAAYGHRLQGHLLMRNFLPVFAGAMCAASLHAAIAADQVKPAFVEVWVDLTLAPLAQTDAGQRAAQLERVRAQQAQVTHAIQQLPGEVVASVTHVRNALAVRIDPQLIGQLRAIEGVHRVSAITHRKQMRGSSAGGPVIFGLESFLPGRKHVLAGGHCQPAAAESNLPYRHL
jgi:hypothetical protein